MGTYKILKNVEYFFCVLIVLCLGYAAYFFIVQGKSFDSENSQAGLSGDSQDNSLEDSSEITPYELYAKQIDARDVFVPPKAVKPAGDMPAAGELPSNFKVVGMVFSNPAQVIIEDQSARRTYFISQDAPSNGISIKQVLKDRIVLDYQGQAVEVRLMDNKTNVPKS